MAPHEEQAVQPAAAVPRITGSARLPLVLLISIGTAAVFHFVFWLLWTYARGLF